MFDSSVILWHCYFVNERYLTRNHLNWEDEMAFNTTVLGIESSVYCEHCGKQIAKVVDGNFIAITEWSMSREEEELCMNCYEISPKPSKLECLK